MAYTTIDNPELYFQTKLYSGSNSSQSITLDGDQNMQPDWVWIKSRNGNSRDHCWYDSVRGVNKRLQSNTSDAEDTTSDQLTSFDSNGFSMGVGEADINSGGRTYVAWNWKESATAGFDIVSYTGNGSARTISHSLSAVPNWILVKPRENSSEGWAAYHHQIASDPQTDSIRLDETNPAFDNNGYWNDTAPTSSVFTVGNDNATNVNGEGIIAYLWSEKQGFSKFGSYEGNGSSDGTFIYTGFKPAWVVTKSIDTTSHWNCKDNKRSTFNRVDDYHKLNEPTAEDTGVSSHAMDFLSNGFKHRGDNDEVNGSETYIYMAFAESPFVNSNGVPTNAR